MLISRKSSIYGAENISIGSNVRIDDFCILSGKIEIGNFVHIAPYTSLCGGKSGIILKDFVNLSRKIEIFAVSDDFSGETLTNPMIPDKYKKILDQQVLLEKHVLIGASSIILPGVTIKARVAGALSLVKDDLTEWKIFAGIPAKPIKPRKKFIRA
ncbi:MAG: hypothetical protein MZV64_26430 [Ignavibacteriales bacterium]|nr:hypothetical protein [Ignavibacteriales bacterium]